MLSLPNLTTKEFLQHYWQKKFLYIPQALPGFINYLSPDELAGLAVEDEVESRLVIHSPERKPYWQLLNGPFKEKDFAKLPPTHWTLLVQGVDRLIPELASTLNHFDFLPQWRFDDVMVSYASMHGSVGPHYDNYDVFLYQAKGRRQWQLTTQQCEVANYLPDVPLRIMKEFAVEETIILEEGDMLYLPPFVGHHGIALTEDCMTYSFGYRSYKGQELWDSLGEYSAQKNSFNNLFKDPDWSLSNHTSELIPQSWQQAKQLMQELLSKDEVMQSWFGCFATQLDRQVEQELPLPLSEEEIVSPNEFLSLLQEAPALQRDTCCRIAYILNDSGKVSNLFINGEAWPIDSCSTEFIQLIANNRLIDGDTLLSTLSNPGNIDLLYTLWKLRWLDFAE